MKVFTSIINYNCKHMLDMHLQLVMFSLLLFLTETIRLLFDTALPFSLHGSKEFFTIMKIENLFKENSLLMFK